MRQPNLPQNAGLVEWIGPDHPFYPQTELIHCIRLPQAADLSHPTPAVVLLHGWGGDECAMWLFQQVIPKIAAVITPRAPLELGSNSFIWFNYRSSRQQPDRNSLQASLGKLRHFLGALPDLYPIDLDRLALMGFSQGAAMGHTLALTSMQPKLAGLVSLSGFMPDLPELAEPANMPTGLPVFITHGSRDEIVPVAQARQSRDLYQRLGAEVTYSEYTTGHKVHREAIKALKKWLRDILCDQIGGTNDERCNPS